METFSNYCENDSQYTLMTEEDKIKGQEFKTRVIKRNDSYNYSNNAKIIINNNYRSLKEKKKKSNDSILWRNNISKSIYVYQ